MTTLVARPKDWGGLTHKNEFSYLGHRQSNPEVKILAPGDVNTRDTTSKCILYMGRRGELKTCSMTWEGAYLKRGAARRGLYRKTGSNYNVQFADYKTPYLIDELIYMPDWARGFHCLIDEIQSAALGRRSLNEKNTLFSQVLTQIRKFKIEMSFTTQFPQVLDYQVLLQVDYFVRCNKRNFGREALWEVYDWWGQDTGKDFRKPWPPVPGTHDAEITAMNTHYMFGLYDTNEYQPSVYAKNRDEQIEKRWDLSEKDKQQKELEQKFGNPEEPLKVLPAIPESVQEYLDTLPKVFDIDREFEVVRRIGKYKSTAGFVKDLVENYHYEVLEDEEKFKFAHKLPSRRIPKEEKKE